MTVPSFTVACIQQACGNNKHADFSAISHFIHEAHQRGADLIVLPELHGGPYFCQTEDVKVFELAEPLYGPTTEFLANMAAKLDIVIVGSIFERRSAGLHHNTAVVLEGNRGLVGYYRKMHIPDDPGFYEKFYFTPGDANIDTQDLSGFQPISTRLGKLGVLVCWDQWYPEAARLMTLRGADVLIYPTAIGWTPSDTQHEKSRQLDAWITIQRSHAIANGLPVVSCNRVGYEPSPDHVGEGLTFWGNSFIAGPQGEWIAQSTLQDEAIIIGEIQKKRTHDVRVIWPFLRDRRVDAYADIRKRWID